jgi:hypothetical protein
VCKEREGRRARAMLEKREGRRENGEEREVAEEKRFRPTTSANLDVYNLFIINFTFF